MKVLTRNNLKINKTPYKRDLDELFAQGVIVLDKPMGPKCKYVIQRVKRALEVAHAGHIGTLDPLVTGVLTLVLNKATKLTGVLSEADKTYEGIMKIHSEVSDEDLKKAFKKFTGVIEQMPPKISAVKRVLRKRRVHFLTILEKKEASKDLLAMVPESAETNNKIYFRVKCQHGTYIRKLCHDIGEHLGVGASMWRLRRIASGSFTEKEVISLEDLRKSYREFMKTRDEKHIRKIIRPIEDSVQYLEKIWIDDNVLPRLKHGSPIFVPGIIRLTSGIRKGVWVAIFDQKNKLCAVGKGAMTFHQIMKAKRGLAIKTDIVLI